jgi:DNA-binding transcriptional ArsR family regulator
VILAPESVAGLAGMLADRSRAAICVALLDGRAWTAAELASQAGIARPTATEHLNQLVQAGLLTEERQGRHRYLRLASPQIAQLIEDMAMLAGQPAPAHSLRTVRAAADLAAARTCYDHLAGTLGVAVFDAMIGADLVSIADGVALTPAGRSWFSDLAGPEVLRQTRSRPLVRGCLDWTERRPHLGGALGAVLYRQLSDRGWVSSCRGSRAVRLTPAGQLALGDLLGIGPHPAVPGRAPAARPPLRPSVRADQQDLRAAEGDVGVEGQLLSVD